ncbi:MAG: PKD domain-containing protein, partial [Bacteroidota bacterium]
SNLCSGLNTCNWQDANGCLGTSTVTINQPQAISVSIPTVSTICIGESSNLTANALGGNGSYTYTWSSGATPNNTVSVSVSPTVTTIYSVTVTDGNNCAPAVSSVTVTVNPPLLVTGSADVTLCSGQIANLSAAALGGDGNYSYSWSPSTNPTTGPAVSATPVSNTTYTVTVTDGCGTPSATDIINVTVSASSNVTVTASQTSGCAPVCAVFNANSNNGLQSINWSFTNGVNTTGSPTSSLCFNNAGTYGVTVNYLDNNGCPGTYTDNSILNVYAVPVAEFSASPETTTVYEPLISFTDLSSGAVVSQWNWNFGNVEDSSSTSQNPSFMYTEVGPYVVSLVVTTSNGCSDSVQHTVYIADEFSLYVPNAFTPNQDGKNEVFQPKGLGVDE